MIRRIFKRIRKIGQNPGRARLAFAFIAGMAVTAMLAQTPAIADILSPQPIEAPVAPAAPGLPEPYQPGANLDTGQTVIIELVYTPGAPAGAALLKTGHPGEGPASKLA